MAFVDKVEALKHYKFSLAFENSNEDDYVIEKLFQSLVAGVLLFMATLIELSCKCLNWVYYFKCLLVVS